MVYGFAQQSGGQVLIESEPGAGATVSIYLRAVDGVVQQLMESNSATAPNGNGQRVLIVEDDPSVRLLIREVLGELSYDTIAVAEANAALSVLRSDRSITLLISDVGLPGMNGRQLAEAAARTSARHTDPFCDGLCGERGHPGQFSRRQYGDDHQAVCARGVGGEGFGNAEMIARRQRLRRLGPSGAFRSGNLIVRARLSNESLACGSAIAATNSA